MNFHESLKQHAPSFTKTINVFVCEVGTEALPSIFFRISRFFLFTKFTCLTLLITFTIFTLVPLHMSPALIIFTSFTMLIIIMYRLNECLPPHTYTQKHTYTQTRTHTHTKWLTMGPGGCKAGGSVLGATLVLPAGERSVRRTGGKKRKCQCSNNQQLCKIQNTEI